MRAGYEKAIDAFVRRVEAEADIAVGNRLCDLPDEDRARCQEIIGKGLAEASPFMHPVTDGPRLVILESPYAGDVERNIEYARAAMRDCLMRGEAPMVSHLLYTQPGVLDDDDPSERGIGIERGLAWRRVAQASVVYTDRGISNGMRQGIEAAREAGIPVEFRALGDRA